LGRDAKRRELGHRADLEVGGALLEHLVLVLVRRLGPVLDSGADFGLLAHSRR